MRPRHALLVASAQLLLLGPAWADPAAGTAGQVQPKAPPKPTGYAPAAAAALGRAWFNTAQDVTPTKRGATYGPNTVPHNFVVDAGNSFQAGVLFDKTDKQLKQKLLLKAVHLQSKDLEPWQKIDRLQKLIRAEVEHAGNDFDTDPSNKYSLFTKKKARTGDGVAKLGDFLRLGLVTCREMAMLTQAALEAAGIKSRLVRGSVYRNGKIVGGHTWNEIRLDGKWQIVDTTNPQFNRTEVKVATSTGTSNGWVWKTMKREFYMEPFTPKQATR